MKKLTPEKVKYKNVVIIMCKRVMPIMDTRSTRVIMQYLWVFRIENSYAGYDGASDKYDDCLKKAMKFVDSDKFKQRGNNQYYKSIYGETVIAISQDF